MRSDILHVDLDAFYASVERRRRPELAAVPVIVGGGGPRGVVLSCSYEARAAGVRNGMPGVRAKRLCPDAVFVAPEFDAYQEASEGFRAILGSFTPLVEPISLDEAFCDVSGARRLHGSSTEIARKIRERVRAELDLVCSVGGGPSKLVAKLASKACKPDGLLVVEDVQAFLEPLPVEELWGVGAVTAEALRRIGVRTVGDLARAPAWTLRQALGEAHGDGLGDLARGIDPRPVDPNTAAKSVGAEETFAHDLTSADRLHAELLRLSDRVASRLMAEGLAGRTVTLKIRLASFATHTRSRTLSAPTSDAWTIHRVARAAFDAFARGRQGVRLLGVSVSGLVSGPVPEQLTLEDGGPDYARAEEALTEVRRRFGEEAVGFARLLDQARNDPDH